MIKRTSPYDYDFQESPVGHIKVAKSGLGSNDLAAFVKRAGDEAAWRFSKLAHHPGEEYLHMLAMGATEVISPNRNGDGWTEAILIQSYPSFTKHAFYHRNHKVEESDGVYGKVRDAWYNKKMGRVELVVGLFANKEAAQAGHAKRGRVADKEMHMIGRNTELPVSMSGFVPYDECFKAGTLVETDRGMIAIETIRTGDFVRSHTGKLQQVTRVLKRAYAGTMVDITVMGVPEVISTTAEHPFLAVKKTAMRACQGSVRNRNGRKAKRRHTFRNGGTCVSCKKQVDLKRDWHAAQDLRVGDYVTCPMVKPGSLQLGESKAYLLGLYAGDGSIVKKTRTREKLVENVAQGLSFSLDNVWPEVTALAKQHACTINGRDNKDYSAGADKQSTTLLIYDADFSTDAQFLIGTHSDLKQLNEEIFNLVVEDRLAFLAGWLDSDGCIDSVHRTGTVRISTVNRTLAEQCKRLISGLGYNASVVLVNQTGGYQNQAKTSYIVSAGRDLWQALAEYSAKINGTIEHTRSATQTVSVDGYSHMPVQEVRHYYDECDVYNLSVEEDETYIVSGIAVHNCSGCGHRARGRKEYCRGDVCKYGGLYHNIGRVFEDGHHLHAVNPETRFFDISGIYDENSLTPDRQADRVAYVLGQIKSAAAKADEEPTVPWWIYEPNSQWARKQAILLPDMVRAEKGPSFSYHGSALDYKPASDWKSASVRHALNDLAKRGVCLSLADFAIICNATPELAAQAEPFAKTAFNRLASGWQLEALLEENPFRFDASVDNPQGKALFSMHPEEVRKRAWLAVMTENPNPPTDLAENQPAEALADLHALYRLGFAASLEKSAKLDLILPSIARHNRYQ